MDELLEEINKKKCDTTVTTVKSAAKKIRPRVQGNCRLHLHIFWKREK
jgi:hypothetical protein